MKIERKKLSKKMLSVLTIFLILLGCLFTKNIIDQKKGSLFEDNVKDVAYTPTRGTVVLEYLQKEAENQVVFDNLTMDQLTNKLNKVLHSTLEGTGKQFATRSVELGLDPYLAVAVVLHETGCKWNCSKLVRTCNNVGGMKTGTKCNGSSYGYFPTLEEGINAYLDNLYNNYVAKGLTTPEQINTRYASSKAWASKIHKYMNEIKAG